MIMSPRDLGSNGPTLEEVDAVLRQDFVAFLAKVFATVDPGHEFKLNWHHRVIAHHLREVMEGRCQYLIVNLPPRSLKSIMMSVALPAFVLGHHATKRIICASYAQDLSAKLSRDTRTVMESPWYKRIFPATRLDPEHNTEGDFSTTQRGQRFATSVGGVLTGLGGDLIIIDDPHKSADAASERAREAAKEWFNTTVSTRLDDKKKGAIVVVMQRLHPDDLTGHLRRAGGWTILDIPAIAPEARDYEMGEGVHHQREAGDVLQPEYESREDLRRRKHMMGSQAFDAQYQQSPVSAEGAQVKREWIHRYERWPLGPLYQSWDTATSKRETNDWSVGTTWAMDRTGYYLVDVVRVRVTYPELRDLVDAYAFKWGCQSILIEDKGAGQILIQERQKDRKPVIPYMPKGDKFFRLAQVAPLIESGAVRFPWSAPWLDAFINELLQFPNGNHDDQVDSLSQFLLYMKERETPDMWRCSF
jgi:predicted phage terminase large subunit-like protein